MYFDSFAIEQVSQEGSGKTKDKSITHNIFRIQGDGSIMWILLCCIHGINDSRKSFVSMYQFILQDIK